MINKYFCLYLLPLFLLASCDWGDKAHVTRIVTTNNSSFDLRISFIPSYHEYNESIDDLELKINSTGTYLITAGEVPPAYDPYLYIDRIVFTDLNNGSQLNIVKPDNLFVLIKIDKGKYGGEDAMYSFEITDSLLQ